MQNKRQFVLQAFLLTGVSLLLRSVGVCAQIYIAARVGAEAVGIFSLIGSVSGFAVTLALSGIQLGVTRMVAAGLGQDSHSAMPNLSEKSIHQTMTCAVLHALFFGILSGTLLFFLVAPIGSWVLHDLRTTAPLRIMALTIPLIPLSACFSGYFVAVRRVYKSAILQVGEELLRVTLTLLFLHYAVRRGTGATLLSLAVSGAIADILSGVALLILYTADIRRHFPSVSAYEKSHERFPLSLRRNFPIGKTLRRLLSITMPVAVASYARSGLVTLEHTLIPVGLRLFGLTQSQALSSYGALHSMALPVVLFPSALLSSFAGLLIPEVTEAQVRKEKRTLHTILCRVFSLSLLFSIGVAGILLSNSFLFGEVLYHSTEVGINIRLLAPLIPVMYLDSAVDAILKGQGQQLYCMKVNILDALVSVILVWILIPRIGLAGYVASIYTTEILNAALSIVRLLTINEFRLPVISWIVKPIFSIIAATSLTNLSLQFFPAVTTLPPVITLVYTIFLSGCLYLFFLTLLRTIRQQEIHWFLSFFQKGTDNPRGIQTGQKSSAPAHRHCRERKKELSFPTNESS